MVFEVKEFSGLAVILNPLKFLLRNSLVTLFQLCTFYLYQASYILHITVKDMCNINITMLRYVAIIHTAT